MFSLSRWHCPAILLLLTAMLASPLAAQDVSQGGITTEQLEPLGPGADDATLDGRFKLAPFKTPEIPFQPIGMEFWHHRDFRDFANARESARHQRSSAVLGARLLTIAFNSVWLK